MAICSTTKSSELPPLAPQVSCQEHSILCTVPFRKKEKKKKRGKEKILLPASKEKHPFCTNTLACVEQRWTSSSEEGLQHTHVLAPSSLKASLFLLLPLVATPAYSKTSLHEMCQLSSISTMHFLIPWPSYTIHHMLVFSRHYKNLRFAHQKAHLSARFSPGELRMKCFLHFHRWEVHPRCWHAAWLGNQKQTSLPLWLVHRLIHYDKSIVQNKNII